MSKRVARNLYSPKDEIVLSHYGEILRQLVVERGGNGERLLEGTGIRPAVLSNAEGRLSYQQFSSLIRNALRETHEPALGVFFGQRLNPMTHGVLGQAVMTASTIQQALEIVVKYYKTRFSAITLDFSIEGSFAVIQLDEHINFGDLKPFIVEMLFVSIIEGALVLFGPRLTEGGMTHLSYPQPDYVEHYRPFFRDQVVFEQPLNQLRFSAQFLQLPMAMANPVARQLAERKCEEQLRELQGKESLVAQVRQMLESSEDRIPSMDEVAGILCVTPRTLRRQLQSFDTSYQDLLAEVLCQRAQQLLLTTDKTVEEIASLLGYQDPSNFGRAFRRWTGLSPREFRERG